MTPTNYQLYKRKQVIIYNNLLDLQDGLYEKIHKF